MLSKNRVILFCIAVTIATELKNRNNSRIIINEVNIDFEEKELLHQAGVSSIDLAAIFSLIQLCFSGLRAVFRHYFEARILNFRRYEVTLNLLQSTIRLLERPEFSVGSKMELSDALEIIEHELACMDESMNCIGSRVCRGTKTKFLYCLDFPFGVYKKEVVTIKRELEEILYDFDLRKVPNSLPEINLARTKYVVKDLKSLFWKLLEVDTKKWDTHVELALVVYVMKELAISFDKADTILREYEESLILSRLSNSTVSTSLALTQSLATLFVNMEAELLELMNPTHLSSSEVELRVAVQEALFQEALTKVKEMDLNLSEELETRVYKIHFLLSW